MSDQIKTLYDICLEAGKEIMSVYEQDFDVAFKEDDSPLTIADERAHHVISQGLKSAFPDIPILSEEGRDIPYEERKKWSEFWLVDPVDGTKEFIKKNGEFTVNIALVEGNVSTLGVIYAPALDIMYIGSESEGAYKVEQASKVTADYWLDAAVELPMDQERDTIHVVASRSHMSEETEAFIEGLKGDVQTVSSGSSLKFCLVAEGEADYYPRYAPTMEWDTGAGQAIVEAAGGQVLRESDGERFTYNKKELLNEWFLVKR
ncbi:3'(2'), 5'-bisphosphate nucleotidase [Alkalibacillus filiformis]|uniref:3'(2'),5'-bisphosphate nucleotidase CysQ n=1 Tax=Alkalibacillus filiformis TaxID=200990 RepID=A0ABU0DWV8_9BACI|nr:3'(2'),5'-bisphosphate nucleotidase CysQ [Alkalibacillus filiformis]MDQ0352751.1 3'(2'), 5'-bisphosphate nucleotidase [Alkalibacillus filiformis]